MGSLLLVSQYRINIENRGGDFLSNSLQNREFDSSRYLSLAGTLRCRRDTLYNGDARRLPSSRRQNIISLAFKQVGHAAVPGVHTRRPMYTNPRNCRRGGDGASWMHAAHFQLIFRYGRTPSWKPYRHVCAWKCSNIVLPDYSRQNLSALWVTSSSRVGVMSFYSAIFSKKDSRARYIRHELFLRDERDRQSTRKLFFHFRKKLLYKSYLSTTFPPPSFSIFHP